MRLPVLCIVVFALAWGARSLAGEPEPTDCNGNGVADGAEIVPGTSLVSVNEEGAPADGLCSDVAISEDGRLVAFHSAAANLIPGSTQPAYFYVADRFEQTIRPLGNLTPLINDPPRSYGIDATPNGQIVAFSTDAWNEIMLPYCNDVSPFRSFYATYVFDAKQNQIVSGICGLSPALSADGRYLAFESSVIDLVPGDTNQSWDVFRLDRQSGKIIRVSVSSAGQQGDADSGAALYRSSSGPLIMPPSGVAISGDPTERGQDEILSVGSRQVAMSADGRFIAFGSDASNLVAGDTNAKRDVFVHDCELGVTERVSVGSTGEQGNGGSSGSISGGWLYAAGLDISSDGRFVAFDSWASNLVAFDRNLSAADIFVRDRLAGTTRRVSIDTANAYYPVLTTHPQVSDDGRHVSFLSNAGGLAPGQAPSRVDLFNCFRYDVQTHTFDLVSKNSNGEGGSYAEGTDFSASPPAMTPDGLWVAFSSSATNLAGPPLDPPVAQVFVRHRVNGTDCNGNGQLDTCDVASGIGSDCNHDSIPDECQPDCNGDGIPVDCRGLTRLYVNAAASGANSGESWANAFNDLQRALDVAAKQCGDVEIWVAAGRYLPSRPQPGGDKSDPRDRSFTLLNRVAVFGGFDGHETQLEARDPSANLTVLSGDVPGVGAYVVVGARDVDRTAVLDGFSFEGTSSVGISSAYAAPIINGCSFIGIWIGVNAGIGAISLNDCVFEQNAGIAAAFFGSFEHGAWRASVYRCVFQRESSNLAARVHVAGVDFVECSFLNNNASGVLAFNSATPTFERCNFSNHGGIGLQVQSAAFVKVRSCRFEQNLGGAIRIQSAGWGETSIADSVFVGNGPNAGSAISITTGGAIRIGGCSFANNQGTGSGGVFASSPSSIAAIIIENCVLWNNRAAGLSGQDAQVRLLGGTNTVSYSCVEGWTGSLGGVGNFGKDPMFVNALGADGIAGTADDDVSLSHDSPCVEAGDPAFVAVIGSTDVAGRPRVMGCRLDVGAYEYAMGGLRSADMNGDGERTAKDAALFVEALLNGGNAAELCAADFNGDGLLDGVDVQGFVGALVGAG